MKKGLLVDENDGRSVFVTFDEDKLAESEEPLELDVVVTHNKKQDGNEIYLEHQYKEFVTEGTTFTVQLKTPPPVSNLVPKGTVVRLVLTNPDPNYGGSALFQD